MITRVSVFRLVQIARGPMTNKTILIADDEAPFRRVLMKMLRPEGFQIYQAVDGIEAVEIAQNHSIDLAILDIQMPRMDGLEAMRRIKAIDKTIEVIILTGHADPDSLKQSFIESNAFDYMLKPFETGEMRRTVQSALRRKDRSFTPNLTIKEKDQRIDDLERGLKEKIVQLRQTQIRYKDIVENSNDMIVVAQDWKLKFVNPMTAEITGYTQEELLEIPFLELIHPEDRTQIRERYAKRIKGETVPHIYSYRQLKKDGTFFWAEINAVRTIWEGQPATLNIIRDITERKQAEEEKAKLEAQLQQSQKMEALGTLAGGIAHDFNNILSSVIGFTQLNMDIAPKGTILYDNLKHTQKAGHRARDLIKLILAFSREREHAHEPVRIVPIIEEVLIFLKASLPSTIKIRRYLKAETPIIEANPNQIHQVLMNLCTNATDAMRESGGVLRVSLTNVEIDEAVHLPDPHIATGKYVKLAVADTGQGIAPDILKKIFDPYFTTKEMTRGTGLGLSVALGIVKGLGGTINVESEICRGSTFSVYFPVLKADGLEETDLPEEMQLSESIPHGVEQILFIDDEKEMIDMGTRMLRHLGYKVVAQKSSLEALELFRRESQRYDLVITDMTMPDLRGDELARQLINVRLDIPIILCTGNSNLISKEKAESIGINAFLMKPIDMQKMAQTIRMVLDV